MFEFRHILKAHDALCGVPEAEGTSIPCIMG